MNAYFKAGSYGIAFAAGVFAMWLWHNASINRIEKNDAVEQTEIVAGQLDAAINDGKQAGENSGNYLKEYNDATVEISALRKRISDGTVRLRVCEAVSATAGVQAGNSSAAKDEAEANIARYREDALYLTERGKEVDRWINSAHSWINK